MAAADALGVQWSGFRKPKTEEEGKAAAERTSETILQKWQARPELAPGWRTGGNWGRA